MHSTPRPSSPLRFSKKGLRGQPNPRALLARMFGLVIFSGGKPIDTARAGVLRVAMERVGMDHLSAAPRFDVSEAQVMQAWARQVAPKGCVLWNITENQSTSTLGNAHGTLALIGQELNARMAGHIGGG